MSDKSNRARVEGNIDTPAAEIRHAARNCAERKSAANEAARFRCLAVISRDGISNFWRYGESFRPGALNTWPPGLYSMVRFELVEQGPGAKIAFDHTGLPKGDAARLAEGWKVNDWGTIGSRLKSSFVRIDDERKSLGAT